MSKLSVVGIGPGDRDNMTVRALNVLRECEVIAGYSVYLELIRELFPDKEYICTGMTQEVQRCRMALESAAAGRRTAMVCSGDSGVYGMAALIYELRGESAMPEIEVVAGLTAACSGAALLGAPLTHDFSVISLSDRLTPWELIERRLTAAAEADMTIVLYNPASRGRPEHLRRACEVLLRVLPPERLCGMARNIGREGENWRLFSLGELRNAAADMFCTVFVGSESAREINGRMVTPRGYRDV